MIVTCPCPNSKKFEVDDSLIPKKGRLVQCGFCGHKWHFNIEQNLIEINKNEAIFSSELKSNNNEIENDINNTVIENHNDKIVSSEQDDYTEKKKISNSSKYLKFLIVIIISFIGLIIILDTFKYPLKAVFPQSENMLQNLYETLKDIFLFFIDLVS